MTRTRVFVVLSACAIALLAVAMGGCTQRAANLDPPAQAVQGVLELRYERSSDASAYAEYFASVDLAVALAQDATASVPPTGTAGPPIPEWEPPYVSAQTSATADVVVQWKGDSDFPEWPPATLFNLEFMSEAWKIVDAQEVTGTAPPRLDSEAPNAAP